MWRGSWFRVGMLALALGLPAVGVVAADKAPSRAQTLKEMEQPSAEARRAAVRRLGQIGTMADADRLVARLRDEDDQVRVIATVALWQIWGRSGDKAIDALYQRGLQQMEMAKMQDAVATFSEIIRKKPAFAEAWNKRATLYYMLGEFALSMKDCDEVLKRNPNHFGALSGYGQMYISMGDFEHALTFLQRALKINPNMPEASATIPLLQQQIQEKQRKTI